LCECVTIHFCYDPMNTSLRSTIVLLFLFPASQFFAARSASAQSIWKYFSRPDIGAGISGFTSNVVSHQNGVDLNSTASVGHYGGMVDFNFPIQEVFPHASVGLMPGIALGISPNTQSDFTSNQQSADITFPIFATFKFNNDATWKGNDGTAVGFTGGIGYMYHMFLSIQGDADSHSFGNPAWMAEINLGERHSSFGLLKFRYVHAIGSGYNATTNGVTETIDNPSAIYIIMTLGY